MNTTVRKAVFPVGGLGTRFLPATKSMPKEMLPVVDKPLIQYAVEEARAAGVEEFIFVTGRGKAAIEDHFDHSHELTDTLHNKGRDDLLQAISEWMLPAGQVAYTRQQEPLGLGHAVWCARHLVGDEPFAVLLADDLFLSDVPVLQQMAEARAETGGNVIAVQEVPREETSRYGVIKPKTAAGANNLVEIAGLVEKPKPEDAPSNLAIVGRYILDPRVMDILGEGHRGAGGEIQLTDAMQRMVGDQPFHGYRFAGERFDCGDKVGFLCANVAFGLTRREMRAPLKNYLDNLPHRG